MSRQDSIRKSRRQLGELLGLAPCPAPSPQLFKAVINSAPQPASPPRSAPALRWRQPRFAVAVVALLMVAAVSFHFWQSNDDDELADVDELAAASSLVL